MTVFSRTPLVIAAMIAALAIATSQARAQDDDATGEVTAEDEEAPVGLAVDGVIRSNRGGFAFPDGSRMTGPPRLSLGGPYECAPSAGESPVLRDRGELGSLFAVGDGDVAVQRLRRTQLYGGQEKRRKLVDRGREFRAIRLFAARLPVLGSVRDGPATGAWIVTVPPLGLRS